MGIPTAERARVPRQCVVSRGLAGPKGGANLPSRRGKPVNIPVPLVPGGGLTPRPIPPDASG